MYRFLYTGTCLIKYNTWSHLKCSIYEVFHILYVSEPCSFLAAKGMMCEANLGVLDDLKLLYRLVICEL